MRGSELFFAPQEPIVMWCRNIGPGTSETSVSGKPFKHQENSMTQLQKFGGSAVKASSVIGTDVTNPKGENLGEVKEVVIDPTTGKVAYAVVTFGGVFSMGEKLFAIPFTALKYNYKKNEYVLDITKERLENAPGFDPDQWPMFSDEKWNRGVYAYYEEPPFWE
jgi:sporulation protein YlmC with PRC-barrel domain